MLDEPVAFREDGCNIQLFVPNSFSHTRNCLRKIEHLDRAEQCLARVAAPVVTLPTDQTILDERYRKACRCKLPHGGHTAHPAAYDDRVEVFASHIHPHVSALCSAVFGCEPSVYT